MNLPNKLSLLRIIMIPFLVFFYLASFIPYGKVVAAVIFILAALTDMLDGKIARKYNLITTIGKFLDSIADKLLVTAGLILVCFDIVPQPYGLIASIVIICRELVVSALRQIAAANNCILAADMWGKVKATVQFVAIPLFMVLAQIRDSAWLSGTAYLVFEIVGYVALGLAVLLTIMSCVHYLVHNRKVFTQEDTKKDEN